MIQVILTFVFCVQMVLNFVELCLFSKWLTYLVVCVMSALTSLLWASCLKLERVFAAAKCNRLDLDLLQFAGMKAAGDVKSEAANPLLSFSEVTHTLLNGD